MRGHEMRVVGAVLVLILSLTFNGLRAQDLPSRAAAQSRADIVALERDVKANADDIAVLRRDQINYRVEKDLLKEAYASNLQSINLIVAIVFGVVTLLGGVLGYLGVKSVKELRADYARELEELRGLKNRVEQEFIVFQQKQVAVESQVLDLAKTNQEQDRRLKILELTEKAAQYAGKGNVVWAIEYADAGLAMDPKNIKLLSIKAVCLSRRGEFEASVEMYKKVLEQAPEDKTAIENTAEALVFSKKVREFDAWYKQHKGLIDLRNNGALTVFLHTLREIFENDVAGAKNHLIPFVNQCANGAAPRLGTWEFQEATLGISQLPDGSAKTLASNVIQFFAGSVSKEALQATIPG